MVIRKLKIIATSGSLTA